MPCGLPELDLDEVLAYKTKKVVIIKDRFLGGLYYAGLFGVLVYFLVDQLIIDQAFMKRETCVSIVETSLQRPPQMVPNTSLKYCQGGPGGEPHVLPCTTGPDVWVRAPSDGDEELFVATRIKDILDGEVEDRYFIQEPENYTVGITFTMGALRLYHKTGKAKYSQTLKEITTRLVDKKGKELVGAVTRNGRFDIIKVGMLAHAAGLDDISSVRYRGAVFVVTVDCKMDRSGSINKCKYVVEHLNGAQDEQYMVSGVQVVGGNKRIQDRRGLKIIVAPAGEMGQFSWSALLTSWVSSLGMLGIITFGVDFLMSKVMPLKEIYSLLKWDKSPDFSDFREGEGAAVAYIENISKSQVGGSLEQRTPVTSMTVQRSGPQQLTQDAMRKSTTTERTEFL